MEKDEVLATTISTDVSFDSKEREMAIITIIDYFIEKEMWQPLIFQECS